MRNPTGEHPARSQAPRHRRFQIGAMRAGHAVGALAEDGSEDVNDESFFVFHPFQDGTPYWLETGERDVDLVAGQRLDLGDVEVVQR